MDYEFIICFETHVELKTESKLFCDCPVDYEASPNKVICPVCTGQPGALPVLNQKAVEYAIKAGIAMNCDINRTGNFLVDGIFQALGNFVGVGYIEARVYKYMQVEKDFSADSSGAQFVPPVYRRIGVNNIFYIPYSFRVNSGLSKLAQAIT